MKRSMSMDAVPVFSKPIECSTILNYAIEKLW